MRWSRGSLARMLLGLLTAAALVCAVCAPATAGRGDGGGGWGGGVHSGGHGGGHGGGTHGGGGGGSGGSDGPPSSWTETYETPNCSPNGPPPDDGDVMCMGATNQVTCPKGIVMRIWTRTDYADGRKPSPWEDGGIKCQKADDPTKPVVSPQQAAWNVWVSVNGRIHTPTIGIVPEAKPGHKGLLGMPTWMWVQNAGPDTTQSWNLQQAQDGYAVRLTANFGGVRWDMGDGTVVNCTDGGTPYQSSYGTQPSPDCGHYFSAPGTYTVTATPQWTVTWRTEPGGQTGQFDVDDVLTSQATIRIGEMQVLNN